jgi:alpha-galactosidase
MASSLPRGTASYLQKEANKITKSLNASYSTPQIISSGNAAGKVGKSFRYQIKSNNKVVNFTTSRLPQGLSLQNKGIISGSPKKAGTYSVKVTAKTNKGSATRVITIVVKK